MSFAILEFIILWVGLLVTNIRITFNHFHIIKVNYIRVIVNNSRVISQE